MSQPVGVRQVVTSVIVPGSYVRATGWSTPNGPTRKPPAWRSSRLPNTLGESKRGTQSQSTVPSGATSAPVWQSDRNAYSAIGVKGDGVAALWFDTGRGYVRRAGMPMVRSGVGAGGAHHMRRR